MRNLVVLDDQMEYRNAHKRGADSVVKFFTQGSHHRNTTVVYIVQNLFNQDKSMRTVSLNAHYIIVFKNPCDGTQIQTLACQMFPGNPTPLLDAFKDATTVTLESGETRGCLLLDFHPTSCDGLSMLTSVFDERPTAYVPREYAKGASANDDHESSSSEADGFGASSATFPSNRRSRIRADAQPRQAQRKEVSRKAHGQVPKRLFKSRAYSSVLKGAPDEVIKAICNAALNVEQGDVHLSPAQRQLFSAHLKRSRRSNVVRVISKASVTLHEVRRVVSHLFLY